MSKMSPNASLVGGIVAAIGASLCCVGPFVVVSLGIGGAWASNLTLLEPYRPLFIALVVALFGWAGWKVYRPAQACEAGTTCATPNARKRRQVIFWITAVIALALVTSAWWIPLLA